MKTVAAVSFHDNHQISMDVESVNGLMLGRPLPTGDGRWFCELLIDSANGKVAVQMLADSPEKFQIALPPPEDPSIE